jgi:hypothetical protein
MTPHYCELPGDFDRYRFPARGDKKPRYERQDRGYETPCWIWLRYCEPKMGYGYSKVFGTPAHRGLYQLLVHEISKSVILHHRCEQPGCVNPSHLQEMSQADHNVLHKVGKKMNLSEEERERRREHGVNMGRKNAPFLYSKQSRSEVGKKRHSEMTADQVNEWRQSVSEGRKKNAPTHCPYGHPYFGENLYISPRGQRACRTCTKRRLAESKARRSV